MAKARKDLKGRALWKGECQRASDKRYVYTYTDTYGKRRSIYAHDLSELRKKEQALMKDKFDGIDSVKARNVTLDRMFERYIILNNRGQLGRVEEIVDGRGRRLYCPEGGACGT